MGAEEQSGGEQAPFVIFWLSLHGVWADEQPGKAVTLRGASPFEADL